MVLEKREMKAPGLLLCLLFFIIGLTQILAPGTVLAWEERTAFTLRLIPGDYNRKVTPGEENTLHLDVHNTGDIPITNVRLSAEPPDDWDIVVDPLIIDRLDAGSMQTVDINIVPARNVGRDTYQVTVIADSNEITRVTRFSVRIDAATSKWTWIGAGVALVVIAGFAFVFIRYSRQ